MTDERTLDRITTRLRTHVAELRRLEVEGADRTEVEERKRLISRLQHQLAYAVKARLRSQNATPQRRVDEPQARAEAFRDLRSRDG